MVREYQDIQWVRDAQGDLASEPEAVGRVVRQFFQKWMESRVSVEERWGSWEKMQQLDTENMPKRFATMVDQLYKKHKRINSEKAHEEGWYEHLLDAITSAELDAAIEASPASSASGPSQVGNAQLHMTTPEVRGVIRQMFNQWIKWGEVPDTLNTALMRLLPKTDGGLDDLNKVRPIALMENIMKVFERILIGRVTTALLDNDVLDNGQYGGLPGAGVQAPLRILAEIIEDANQSKQELHVLIADLSKAFDTMEYWSQELSWQCLGLPEHMVRLLVNLDRGNPGGEGATTTVGLAQGRTTEAFKHGRGVRQGSVGGPLKWIVFVHFWLAWVKDRMAGKGYVMSAAASKRTQSVDTSRPENRPPTAEVLGQLPEPLSSAGWNWATRLRNP